ncbi:MAG: flagellar brake protein [Uliginosibacterium sp.]|nr:flagellar brake protein [Uliginosibacterium sp.]MBK9614566.1 flagellar brake protein [Uliginosibacterium sp.]
MSKAPKPQPRFELLQADDFSQYLLRDRREIAFVLRQLAAKRGMITAYFGESHEFLISSIVDVSQNERQVFLDLGTQEDAIARALLCKELLCVTQLEKVKIQFALASVERTTHDGFPALLAPVPEVLLRLQRREYYRLTAPSSDALVCQIPAPNAGRGTLDVNIVDISGGGVAVVAPPNGITLEPDATYPKCRLLLPDYGAITVTLKIRNVFRMATPTGFDMIRVGCQFLDLNAATANAVQRYILKAERERNARGIPAA